LNSGAFRVLGRGVAFFRLGGGGNGPRDREKQKRPNQPGGCFCWAPKNVHGGETGRRLPVFNTQSPEGKTVLFTFPGGGCGLRLYPGKIWPPTEGKGPPNAPAFLFAIRFPRVFSVPVGQGGGARCGTARRNHFFFEKQFLSRGGGGAFGFRRPICPPPPGLSLPGQFFPPPAHFPKGPNAQIFWGSGLCSFKTGGGLDGKKKAGAIK